MIRKQIYLEADQDRKLKCLAQQRRVTEAEVIREAIEGLPEPEDDFIAMLRAAGMLAEKPPLPPELQGKDRRQLLEDHERTFREEMGKYPPFTLSDAIDWVRDESPS